MSTFPRHINVLALAGKAGMRFPTFPPPRFLLHVSSSQRFISVLRFSFIKTHDVRDGMAFPPPNTRHVAINPCSTRSGLLFAQVYTARLGKTR